MGKCFKKNRKEIAPTLRSPEHHYTGYGINSETPVKQASLLLLFPKHFYCFIDYQQSALQ